MKQHDHFESKTASQHVRKIQNTHRMCRGEPHTDRDGFYFYVMQEIIHILVSLFFIKTLIMLLQTPLSLKMQWGIVITYGISYIFYRSCRAARNAWAYMELCHRSIWQEKVEIDRNPEQEREELDAIFAQYGYPSELAQPLSEYLCSDSSLLLNTMLREELHIDIGNFPHPLEQAWSRGLGGIIALLCFLPILVSQNLIISSLGIAGLLAICSGIKAKCVKNNPVHEIIWSLAISVTSIGILFSISKLFGV